MSHFVNVHIDPKGNGTVDLHGYSGGACQKVADALKSVGKTTEENKPEFYQTNTSDQTLVNGQ